LYVTNKKEKQQSIYIGVFSINFKLKSCLSGFKISHSTYLKLRTFENVLFILHILLASLYWVCPFFLFVVLNILFSSLKAQKFFLKNINLYFPNAVKRKKIKQLK